MALTNEDLQNISSIFSTQLTKELEPIRSDLSTMKTDVSNLKVDMAEVKDDVANLKTDMTEVKGDVKSIKQTVDKNYSMPEEFYVYQKKFNAQMKSLLDNHDSRIISLERIVFQNSLDICNLKEKVS